MKDTTFHEYTMNAPDPQTVLTILSQEYEEFSTELRYDKDWQLLIAVMLSAQTTDANVNKVTPTLFNTYDSPQAIADAPREEIEKIIYSTGYYRAKAKHVQNMCKELITRFNGEVPDTMEDLTSLSGVGRKTANVVLHVLHQKIEGVVMDTHIARVTHRLGYTEKKHPEKAEQTMMKLLPKKDWKRWGDLLIQHGRTICHARTPECERCPLNTHCPSAHTTSNKQRGVA